MHVSEMSYKELVKNKWEIVARYRVIREILVNKQIHKNISKKYRMHRNSIRNLLRIFHKNISKDKQALLFREPQLTLEEIKENYEGLLSCSRRPKHLRWIAPPELEEKVKKLYKEHNWGHKRMTKFLYRRDKKIYKESLIRGIYKRNGYKVSKVRTKKWIRRALYDYKSLLPFEYVHYDVKHILDQWALPEKVYEKFSLKVDLPIYQRTIIDACTRMRWLSYSNHINSTLGIAYLKLWLMFIRSLNVATKMHIGFDWGTEFCSASEKKLAKRQESLSPLNVKLYQYEGSRDVRKNLIERSHKTDDEEFYIAIASKIKDRKTFEKEAKGWFLYYNKYREHSWIAMEWATPYEKLSSFSSILLPERFLEFPILILDECLWDIIYHTKTIDLMVALEGLPTFPDHKSMIDFKDSLSIVNNSYAQNVLDHYLLKKVLIL